VPFAFPQVLSQKPTYGKLYGMANPNPSAPRSKAYIPKPGDPVLVEGVLSRLVVVSVDAAKKTATVTTPRTPGGVYTVLWSKLSYLDESQNAMRIVREATEGR